MALEHENRVVVLIDMDCFYCQVEEKLDPELKGKPIAVVQYNPWQGGGILAVNYAARAKGVTRHMRGGEAKEKCPEIQLPTVPCLRGKADITKYRDAGKEVARILQRFTPLLERASIDEAYLDITAPVQERLKIIQANTITTEMVPNTHSLGYDNLNDFIVDVHNYGNDSIDFDHDHTKRLLVGALVVSEIRVAVFDETGYTCSAGIAHNKILAKLVCGMNKPNKQTILPKHSINILYKTLSVKKVKHLGGKFGDTVCEVLRITKMGELQAFSEKELQARFDEKNGTWLYNIARGIDQEPVQAKFNAKSIGCCKQLRGKSALTNLESLRKWLRDLGDEIEERLEKDSLETNRTPKQMVVSFSTQWPDGRDTSSSRSYNFVADDELCSELFYKKALELLMDSAEGVQVKDDEPNRKLKARITFLGISVGKFEDNSETKKTKKILDYFAAGTANVAKVKENSKPEETRKDVGKKSKKNEGKDYIMQKFLQVTEKSESISAPLDVNEGNSRENAIFAPLDISEANSRESAILNAKPILESTLDKQESFFAKFLKRDNNKEAPNSMENVQKETVKEAIRSTTPVCNLVPCGEDSNDTDCTGSTINMEINKSIALFEDDPHEADRVSNMRNLLTTNVNDDEIEDLQSTELDEICNETNNVVTNLPPVDIFECPECRMAVSMNKIEEHADYHLALKLREEDRQQVRKEIRENKEKIKQREDNITKNTISDNVKQRKALEENKNESLSITSFLVKLDNTVPTEICSECGKKISVEKYAEHLDFHEAQKLSRQLNNKTTPSHLATSNNIKRKRKTVSPAKRTKMPCSSRSIDSFFR